MALLVPKSIKSSLSQVVHLSSKERAAFEAVSQITNDWRKSYLESPGNKRDRFSDPPTITVPNI